MKLIVNPTAANGAVGKNWLRIRDFLQAEGAEFDAVLTEEPGHATQLARQALDDGFRTIVAVGGDGTVNEVINGLVDEGGVDPEVVLGIIPWGTGADFARMVGIPCDYAEACTSAAVPLAKIKNGDPRAEFFTSGLAEIK